MKSNANILVVEDDQFSLKNIMLSLSGEKVKVVGAVSAQAALEKLIHDKFILMVVDIKLPGMDGLELIAKCKQIDPAMKYIVITGYSDEAKILKALKLGVNDFLKKPYEEFEFRHCVEKLVNLHHLESENNRLKEKLEKENAILYNQLFAKNEVDSVKIIGNAPALLKSLEQARQAARYGLNVFIHGESGTGKELIAKFIHANGPRVKKPFIDVNCASLSPSLFEEELFGHEKGAFTGAELSRAGLFEAADGGILYLDEISEISPVLQSKLLRVIETQTIRRVGSANSIDIDVQIIASSNRKLAAALKKNLIRNDLYHRLATVEIYLPPLRERIMDFEPLLNHFLKIFRTKFKSQCPRMKRQQIELIKYLHWEGNIRQLLNFVKKWCLFGRIATDEDIISWASVIEERTCESDMLYHFNKGNLSELEDVKQWLIEKALVKSNGNKSQAARYLGVTYQGLLKMIKKYNNQFTKQP